MELCNHLRLLFSKDSANCIPITDLQSFINDKLDRDYTIEQIIVGMDYAGFLRLNDDYLVEINNRHPIQGT